MVILLGLVFNAFGIFASWAIALCVTSLLGIFLLLPRIRKDYRPRFSINRKAIGETVHFSAANYIAHFAIAAPGFILPIMTVNMLGAEANAYFYIAWMLGFILLSIASAVSMSLFAEGSYDEGKLRLVMRQSLKLTFLILVPVVIIVLAVGDKLLILFGAAYSESGATLLRILAVAALPASMSHIYLGMKRVQKKLATIIALTGSISLGILVLSYILLPNMGINGVGIACLASYGMAAIVITFDWLRGRGSNGEARLSV